MYKERFGFAIQHFAVSHLLLVIVFWLIRLYEFFSLAAMHLYAKEDLPVFIGLAMDAWFSFVLALIVFPVYLFLYLFIGPITRYFLALIFVLYVLVQIGLVSYFVIVQIPLSADFWGYSMDDIQTTVSSSTGISFVSFLPFIVMIGLLLYYYPKVQEVMLPRWALIVYYTAAVVFGSFYMAQTPKMNWFSSESNYTLAINKMAYFGEKSFIWYWERDKETAPIDTEYPFMTDADTTDVLSPFFKPFETKPNLVFIMVEGLGGTFVGPNARYGGCTPFIDSLASNSLYWQYTLSSTGRTFGVLPSLFGSLPYSEKGFMETAPDMPTHLTLFKLLKDRGYNTRYFYGGNANFDKQDVFLEAQGIDYILEETRFPKTYKKVEANSEGFSWGYADGDVFKRSLEVFEPDTSKPYLSVYMTISTHEPFKVPDQQVYLDQLKKIVATKPQDKQKIYNEFPAEFSSLLYMDNAVRNFIHAYQKRADYENTVFVITGDHRMIPVTQANRIDRFHVPLIIFSPKLKRTEMFSSVNTHHDVTPTVLSFLSHQTTMEFPGKVHWLGHVLDTVQAFHSVRKTPLMRNKNELIDYIDGDYFLSDNILYRITPQLDLEMLDNTKEQARLKKELEVFKQKNQYVFKRNKLYNDSLSGPTVKKEFTFTPRELQVLRYFRTDTMNPDQMLAFAKAMVDKNRNYTIPRLVCKQALLSSPNFEDVRLLLGRTYFWEGDYETAKGYFEESRKRSPNSGQPWKALIHNEIMVKHYAEAVKLADEAYRLFDNPDFLELKKEAIEQSKSRRKE